MLVMPELHALQSRTWGGRALLLLTCFWDKHSWLHALSSLSTFCSQRDALPTIRTAAADEAGPSSLTSVLLLPCCSQCREIHLWSEDTDRSQKEEESWGHIITTTLFFFTLFSLAKSLRALTCTNTDSNLFGKLSGYQLRLLSGQKRRGHETNAEVGLGL